MFGGVADRAANINQTYLEYGISDELTLGAKIYIELSTTDLDRSSAAAGAFLRKRIWQDGQGGVASVQGGYAHPIESLIGGFFTLADPGAVPDAHLAGLYGRGWGDVWSGGFISPIRIKEGLRDLVLRGFRHEVSEFNPKKQPLALTR